MKKYFLGLIILFFILLFQNNTVYAQSSRSRSIAFGLTGDLFSGKSVNENSLTVFTKHGWNFSSFEFGPSLKFNLYDLGFGTNIDYLAGAYLDYNIVDNKPPNSIIYGPTIEFTMGNKNYGSDGRAQLTQLKLGGFLTWFFNSSFALKSELAIAVKKVNIETSESNLTGVASQIYFDYYF